MDRDKTTEDRVKNSMSDLKIAHLLIDNLNKFKKFKNMYRAKISYGKTIFVHQILFKKILKYKNPRQILQIVSLHPELVSIR